ncbi:MAG TPA: hypothetical protein H9850_07100 [Candidatus Anaerobiospirillum pullistercoris]|uniref:Uncharacterized protein n=1 Tax=Candidatus Anaerobiospirillum pullistercoris TaxID=2838452 RepID=A0A9D2B1Q5_9GAMM|nr:hypothetical protein [Candidatus Anaerobiospirillum pullistercoris]
MTPSISLEQLATRSKITRKTQKYDYESYQAEYIDLYCRKQNHQSLPASNSTALMGGDTNDEFLKDPTCAVGCHALTRIVIMPHTLAFYAAC